MPFTRRSTAPSGMPVLGRGRHRSPRHGACLMEYTAVLAGRRFSDSPACTDAVLATIARGVNDCCSDDGRQRLAVLAGDLSDAPAVDVGTRRHLVRRCLVTALPHATGERRHVLAVALLGLDRAATGARRGFDPAAACLDTELALVGLDDVRARAEQTLRELPVSPQQHTRHALATAVELALATIATEAPDADDVLYDLLVGCLDDVRDRRQRQDSNAAWMSDSAL